MQQPLMAGNLKTYSNLKKICKSSKTSNKQANLNRNLKFLGTFPWIILGQEN